MFFAEAWGNGKQHGKTRLSIVLNFKKIEKEVIPALPT